MPAVKKPGTPKAAPKKAPPKVTRAQAQKALADLAAKPRAGHFRGITLVLPAQLSASFAFDLAEAEAGDSLAGTHTLLSRFLGREQWKAVREKIAADGQPLDELESIVRELLEAITAPYGVDEGK